MRKNRSKCARERVYAYVYRALLSVDRSLLSVYRALLSVNRAVIIIVDRSVQESCISVYMNIVVTMSAPNEQQQIYRHSGHDIII